MRESKEQRRERQAVEEWQLVNLLQRTGNTVDSEVPITPERRWRVDHVINDEIALEIEGYGRHQSWAGWHSDLAKYNQIAARGWLLVRVTRDMVSNGDALVALAACGVKLELP